MENRYPKVLVVSNNGFSNTSNNGRTLGNYFWGWPHKKIAQFCISISEPNYQICDNYYMISDSEALSAFIHMRKAKRIPCPTTIPSNNKSNSNTVVKTAFKSLLRYCVWANNRWKSEEFTQWINEVDPEIVVCYNSDSAFILDIARTISDDRKIPLVMINTEGFYFFRKNFMVVETFLDRLAYPLYRVLYRHSFKKFMAKLNFAVYLNGKLQKDYLEEFNHKSDVIYTGSDISYDRSFELKHPYVFSYLGNFGFNRWKALIEIARVLNDINPTYKLKVYGIIPSDDIRRLLDKEKAIELKGFVDYETVKEVILSSTILFHAEAQDEEYEEALLYGFTTKIADSVSSGHPFIMYSSPEIAGAQYIIETSSGWHAKDTQELRNHIQTILSDESARLRVRANAERISDQNHNIQKNRIRFHEILLNVINDHSL